MPIALIPELTQIPRGTACTRYVLARIVAPAAPVREGRPPVHLSLVLDRSGSMAGPKIESARRAAVAALGRLAPTDRFSVVFYDDHIDVVVPSTLATPEQRMRAAEMVARVGPGGSTDLSTGWLRGCEQVAEHLPEGAVGRVLLLTDGLANRGIRSVPELEQHAAVLAARGVTTSTFGIGVDFNEELLRKMSTAGGGAFYFIERPEQIEDYMTSETGDALDVTVRNVSLVLRVPEGANVRCRSLWRTESTEGALHVHLGNMLSEQQLDVLLEVDIPAGTEPCRLLARVSDADGKMADDTAQIDLERVENVEGQPDPTVVVPIVEAIAAEARSMAMEAMQRRDREGARRLFEEAAGLIARYAPVLQHASDLVTRLRQEAASLNEMSVMDRKRMHMSSSSASRGRSSGGYAMKSGRSEVGIFTNVDMMLDACGVAENVSRRLCGLPLSLQGAHVRSGRVLSQEQEADCANLYSAKFGHLPLRFVFVASRLHDNWFSHWHADTRTAVVSVADIDPRYLEAFVAYEVLLHILHMNSPSYDSVRLAHQENLGCLFDFCGVRADLEIKLQTMDLCPTCARALHRLGIDVHAVREACNMIRQSALERRLV